MKKIILIICSLVLVLAFSISVYAMCPYCEKVVFDQEPVEGHWEMVDSIEHGGTCRFEYCCDVCGNTDSGHEYITHPHSIILTNVTCNGVIRSYHYECRMCTYKYLERVTCPDKDHSDGCGMPQLNIVFEENIK